MAITTDASIAEAKTTMLAQELIQQLNHNNVLSQFFRSDTSFIRDAGAYNLGATISMPVVPTITSNIVTATGGAVTYPKVTLTNESLTLDSIASTPFSINMADQALANINPENATIQQAAKDHGNKIESTLMLNTFNVAGIDGNTIGAAGTAANLKLLSNIEQAFFDANVGSTVTKVVVLPSDQYAELQQDTQVGRLANPDQSSTLRDGMILDTFNMVILRSAAALTADDYTNLTAVGSNKVGFAFTTDSIVAAVRRLATTDVPSVIQRVVADPTVNLATRLTKSYDANVIGGDTNYHMETLFGTKIYREDTVFPVLGGVA